MFNVQRIALHRRAPVYRLLLSKFMQSPKTILSGPLVVSFGFALQAKADPKQEIHKTADALFDEHKLEKLLHYLTQQER